MTYKLYICSHSSVPQLKIILFLFETLYRSDAMLLFEIQWLKFVQHVDFLRTYAFVAK